MPFLSSRYRQATSIAAAMCLLLLTACHDDDRTANDLPVPESEPSTTASDLTGDDTPATTDDSEDDAAVIAVSPATDTSNDTTEDDDAAPSEDNDEVEETITDLAVATEDLSTLVSALQAAGLDSILADDSETFTVFAPTNAAFEALGEEALAGLLDDPDALSRVLLNHVIIGQSVDSETAISLSGTTQTNASSEDLGIAFNEGSLTINNATVTQADVVASNGVVHVIDQVLIPPAETDVTEEELPNIVETAINAGSFNTLVQALQATELDAVLADESRSFTVFAPTDEAFAALGSVRLENLLMYPDLLSPILLRHVLPDIAVSAAQAFSLVGQSVDTAAEDRQIAISLQDGQLFVDGSQVVTTDIQTSNGVIHVIDAVICKTCEEDEAEDEAEEEAEEEGGEGE